MNALPLSWWLVTAVSGAGFGMLWWRVRGRQRVARRRALARQLGACGRAESADERSMLDGLGVAAQGARRGDRHAERPWFLFLGGATAQVPRLLATLGAPSGPATPLWSWTPLASMTAIAAAPALAKTPEAPAVRRAWCHALLALMHARRHLPLNGIAVCFAARDLQRPQAVRDEAVRLRALIDDAARHLQLQFPVFVMVTGLEALPGYAVVREGLPDALLPQAVGHRLPPDERADAGEVFATLMARMDALRMALVRAHPAATERLAIHSFVEGLRAMEAGVQTIADALFASAGGGDAAQPWRGLYLAAADEAGGVFVRDLFERFLPADRPLARAVTSPRRSGSGARRNSP